MPPAPDLRESTFCKESSGATAEDSPPRENQDSGLSHGCLKQAVPSVHQEPPHRPRSPLAAHLQLHLHTHGIHFPYFLADKQPFSPFPEDQANKRHPSGGQKGMLSANPLSLLCQILKPLSLLPSCGSDAGKNPKRTG